MDEEEQCNNQKNGRSFPWPNAERVAESPILEKCIKIVESKRRMQNQKKKTGNEKAKIVKTEVKRLKDGPAAKSENVKKEPQKLISGDGMAKTAGDASVSENNDLEKNRTTRLPTTNQADSKSIREPTQLEVIPGPSAGISDSLISTESTKTTNLESKKSTRNKKSTTVVEKQKVVASPKNLKRKADHPPTSDMVMDSINALKKRNGATVKDINTYIEENYQVNMKVIKPHVNKFLKKAVDTEILDKNDGVGSKKKYKIKKRKNVERNSQNLRQKEGKVSKKVGTKAGESATKKTAGKIFSKK